MKKSAFSVLELSIVILVIGLLIGGVMQGSRLLQKSRLEHARRVTESSPVHSIKGLVAWFETTLEQSFLDAETSDGSTISEWRDISSQGSNNPKNATQAAGGYRPIYSSNNVTGLPMLRFYKDGTNDHLLLPDGTVPYNDSPYSVFTIHVPNRTVAVSLHYILYSGTNSNNLNNAFGYAPASSTTDYLFHTWGGDSPWSVALPYVQIARQASFLYDNSNRYIYTNGSLNKTIAGGGRTSTSANNVIGGFAYGSGTFGGYIGEIIIFDRALDTDEREAVEQYLLKKWGIKSS
jgi:hypothetical protein